MLEIDVRMVKLPPLYVASALGFGKEPESIAWDKIFAFLKERELWAKMSGLEFYGFNNPDPSPGSPNYGYEQWVVVPGSIEGTDEVATKDFDGGLYAVTRCKGIPHIFETWKKLFAWREDSPYMAGSHQWLEKWVNPSNEEMDWEKMIMDLYLPIVK